jgi:hypothetical protein
MKYINLLQEKTSLKEFLFQNFLFIKKVIFI